MQFARLNAAFRDCARRYVLAPHVTRLHERYKTRSDVKITREVESLFHTIILEPKTPAAAASLKAEALCLAPKLGIEQEFSHPDHYAIQAFRVTNFLASVGISLDFTYPHSIVTLRTSRTCANIARTSKASGITAWFGEPKGPFDEGL